MLGNVVHKLQSSQLAFELTTPYAFIVPDPKSVWSQRDFFVYQFTPFIFLNFIKHFSTSVLFFATLVRQLIAFFLQEDKFVFSFPPCTPFPLPADTFYEKVFKILRPSSFFFKFSGNSRECSVRFAIVFETLWIAQCMQKCGICWTCILRQSLALQRFGHFAVC